MLISCFLFYYCCCEENKKEQKQIIFRKHCGFNINPVHTERFSIWILMLVIVSLSWLESSESIAQLITGREIPVARPSLCMDSTKT